jgi:hypothetical protein
LADLSEPALATRADPPKPANAARIGLERLRRWEFWPAWALYAPIIPSLLVYAWRHRTLTAPAAANPAIPMGGLVGESKAAILGLLPSEFVAPFALLPPGSIAQRLARIDALTESLQSPWPLIIKPDVGERGTGVRLIASRDRAADHLESHPEPLIAQRFHPGPHEFGIFYIRHPEDPSGVITSVTLKRFPVVTGDGHRTIAQLIDADPRLRLQRAVFLRRLGTRAAHVPPPNQASMLAVAGNHCRGTTFLGAPHIATPALLRTLDTISHHARGLFFGRFDIRTHDPASLAAGRDFQIIEFNGLLAEPTHIYEPGFPLSAALRTLREHWRAAFAIGAANAAAGTPRPSVTDILRQLIVHARRPHASEDSD